MIVNYLNTWSVLYTIEFFESKTAANFSDGSVFSLN